MAYSRCVCKKQADYKANLVLYDLNNRGGSKNRILASSGVIALCETCLNKPTTEVRKRLFTALGLAAAAHKSKKELQARSQLLTVANKR